jgi:Holliday junction resolvasome RuvABC ATP-dependent DNA helicase subunit
VIGTSKGIILVFDYQQSLKTIIGTGTKGLFRAPIGDRFGSHVMLTYYSC